MPYKIIVIFLISLISASSSFSAQNVHSEQEVISIFMKSVSWVNPPATAKENREKLVSMGPEILPTLLPLMEKEFLMQQYGLQDIIYGMLSQYQPADTKEKQAALENIKKEIAGYLREHIKANSYEGLRWGVRWLAELKVDPEKDIDAIITQINHPFWRVRSSVASSLGLLESPIAVPYLSQLMKDSEEEIRAQSADAAARIKDPGLIIPLCDLLSDPLFPARMNAADALDKIAHFGYQEKVQTAIIPCLKSDTPKVRYLALELLGRIGTDTTLPVIEPYLKSDDRIMRGIAAEAAGTIGTARIKTVLNKMLENEKDMFVRGRLEYVLNENFGNRKDNISN